MTSEPKPQPQVTLQVTTAPQQHYYLKLTPTNYQQQFTQFVLCMGLTRQQARQLKASIQEQLLKAVQGCRQHYVAMQSERARDITRLMGDWGQKGGGQQAEGWVGGDPRAGRVGWGQAGGEEVKVGRLEVQEVGIQTQSQIPTKKQQHFVSAADPIAKMSNYTHKDQQPLPDVQSPRFCAPPQEHSCNGFSPEQHFPRQVPQMSSHPHTKHLAGNKQTEATSGQHSNDYRTDSGNKNSPQPAPYQVDLKPVSKKLFLLENYQKAMKENSLHQSAESQDSEISFEQRHEPDPQIFTRLHSTPTVSSSNKHMQEINTHEQGAYQEMLRFIGGKKHAHLHGFQAMHAKTTASSRAKGEAEPDQRAMREQKEVDDLQKSFQEHLRRKQEERKLRQKYVQQKQGHSASLKGSHCYAKIIRAEIEKQKEKAFLRQQQIRQRMKSREKSGQSLKSCSPASKHKSRKCCNQQAPRQATAHKLRIKANYASSSRLPSSPVRNKVYVSNILNESYDEFQKQINQWSK